MSGSPTLLTLGLLLFCVLMDIGRELNFKAATLRADRETYIVSLLTDAFLWIGIMFWAIEVVAWLLVLERAPLAIAFPIMALTYAGTPLAAGFVLHETLTRRQKAGAGLVTLGALIVSLSEWRA